MQWTTKAHKQASREYVLDGYEQKHGAIFLPGWDERARQSGQDIRTGLNMGCLDLSSPLYVVERNREWASKIEADLRTLGFTDLIVHVGELCDLELRHKVDLAFIDLLGTLDANVCRWMRDVLAPKLTYGATVAITMAYSRRNNQFMAACEHIYRKAFPKATMEMRELTGLTGHQRLVPVLLVRGIFNQHLFAYRRMMKYRDTRYSMMTYKFTNFERKPFTNGSPALEEVLSHVEKLRSAMSTPEERSQRAHKAHATRRANKEAAAEQSRKAVLSERAKKAAATRRANKEASQITPRSAAAYAAWATRRANGWVHPVHRT